MTDVAITAFATHDLDEEYAMVGGSDLQPVNRCQGNVQGRIP